MPRRMVPLSHRAPEKTFLAYLPTSAAIGDQARLNPFSTPDDQSDRGLSILWELLTRRYKVVTVIGSVDKGEITAEMLEGVDGVFAPYPIHMGQSSQKAVAAAMRERGVGLLVTAEWLNLEGCASTINSLLSHALGGPFVQVQFDRLTDPEHRATITKEVYGFPMPVTAKAGDVQLPFEWSVAKNLNKGFGTRSGATVEVHFEHLDRAGIDAEIIYRSGASGFGDRDADNVLDAGEKLGYVIGGVALSGIGRGRARAIVLGDSNSITNEMMKQEGNHNKAFFARAFPWIVKDI